MCANLRSGTRRFSGANSKPIPGWTWSAGIAGSPGRCKEEQLIRLRRISREVYQSCATEDRRPGSAAVPVLVLYSGKGPNFEV